MTAWSGDFVFGEAWAAYRGSTAENSLHSHAALQLALGGDREVSAELEDGQIVTGRALLIRPAVLHAVSGIGEIGLIYVEPQSPVAFALLDRVGAEDIEKVPDDISQRIDPTRPPNTWFAAIEDALPEPARTLDARLAGVLRWLELNPGPNAISLAVEQSGISESHLRTLARNQLGLPLSTWLIWRKLERGARELSTGATIVDAALAAGFADQAHFTRAMRRMFGITPSIARKTLL
ncbi:MAG: AraC family transcriptional regulator [Reyranella sp.]|nr:AraC family transcriptional regulator [Reyranella sp.]